MISDRTQRIENLELTRETVVDLTESQAEQAQGGWLRPPLSWSCPQPPPSSSHCPVAGA